MEQTQRFLDVPLKKAFLCFRSLILLHFAESKLLSRKLVVAVGSYETFHGFPGWYLWGEKFWQCEIELQPWFPYVILKIDLESFSEASYDISLHQAIPLSFFSPEKCPDCFCYFHNVPPTKVTLSKAFNCFLKYKFLA